jgi:hypothetical protein
MDQERPQIGVPSLADPQQARLSTCCMLSWDEAQPSSEISRLSKGVCSTNCGDEGCGSAMRFVPSGDAALDEAASYATLACSAASLIVQYIGDIRTSQTTRSVTNRFYMPGPA